MTQNQEKPNVVKILDGLKDFQRKSVEYVFRRLYLDSDSEQVRRFLVADEVGLGKTLVARGLIAKAIEHLWDKRERLAIVYICANSDIARQNINKLNITGKKGMAFASRMTLLPLHTDDLQNRKLNFVSFTPGTSFDLRSSGGRWDERVLIYHMLGQGWDFDDEAGPRNLLRLGVGKKHWRRLIKDFERRLELPIDEGGQRIDQTLQRMYLDALAKEPAIQQRFKKLAERFSTYGDRIPDDEHEECVKLIGDLRRVLARSCVNGLKPNLVILDEFQRFKTLLDGTDEVAELAHQVFDYPEAKVLLLSATPYKMYTMYHEQETDDHYADFIRTVGFLFNNDASKTKVFEEDLARYRRELMNLGSDSEADFLEAKQAVENKLRSVMVRTERVSSTSDLSSMIHLSGDNPGSLTSQDVRQFAALDKVAHHLGVGDTLEYWKSAPYLLNVMDANGYKIKEEFVDRIQGGEHSELASLVAAGRDGLISWETVRSYQRIDPGNTKLRGLLARWLDQGAWRLLWVPSSMPYYRASIGPYSDEGLQSFTKSLVFSSWKVVPKVIAMLASYEAERLMVTSLEPDSDYGEERQKRKPLLNFAFSQKRFAGMPVFCLVYPCLALATQIDPLAVAGQLSENGSIPNSDQVLKSIRERIVKLLEPLIQDRATSNEPVDERWYWAALALLDRPDGIAANWLETEDEHLSWRQMVDGEAKNPLEEVDDDETPGQEGRVTEKDDPEPVVLAKKGKRVSVIFGDEPYSGTVKAVNAKDGICTVAFDDGRTLDDIAFEELKPDEDTEGDNPNSRFSQHVDEFSKCLEGKLRLGKPPKDLAEVLATVALASPAVVAFRSLQRVCRDPELFPSTETLLAGAAKIAMGFRSLFNLPESITMIRSIEAGDDSRYWRSVLDYCVQGNLQSVMDEYVHILYESTGASHAPPDEAADTLVVEIENALSIRTASLTFDEIKIRQEKLELADRSLRCRYALRFGDDRSETDQGGNRREQIRQAFNSPFRPFILATTSVGQEGLDFHQYCHEIYHWNLPANPVDLEQREGRIHRYKGHVIRRNVAKTFPLPAVRDLIQDLRDPWEILFSQARSLATSRCPSQSELVPYWIFEDGGHKVLRHVPALPLSLETERLENLRNTIVAYRMVLGQPRQEDLVNYLQSRWPGRKDAEGLLRFRINLAP